MAESICRALAVPIRAPLPTWWDSAVDVDIIDGAVVRRFSGS
jgi:hypothetical protein